MFKVEIDHKREHGFICSISWGPEGSGEAHSEFLPTMERAFEEAHARALAKLSDQITGAKIVLVSGLPKG